MSVVHLFMYEGLYYSPRDTSQALFGWFRIPSKAEVPGTFPWLMNRARKGLSYASMVYNGVMAFNSDHATHTLSFITHEDHLR